MAVKSRRKRGMGRYASLVTKLELGARNSGVVLCCRGSEEVIITGYIVLKI